MGIFDDEARKLANERAAEARSAAQREGEGSNIAHAIADELQNDEASRPENYGASLSIHLNTITISIRTRNRTLTIVCNESDEFYLRDTFGLPTQIRDTPPPPISTREGEPVSKSEMARRVLTWLRAHRTT